MSNNDDLLKGYKLDDLSVAEIDELIAKGELTEAEVIWFYNNQWWRDEV